MKKILFILLIILGIISIFASAYFFINIYFIISTKNNIIYDGFGYELINGKPRNPKIIFAYFFFFLGCSLINYPRKELIKMRDNKNR